MRKILYVLTLVLIILSCSVAKAQLIGEGDTLWCKQLNNIQQILYSPDGTKLGVGSSGQIILFNPYTGDELLRLDSISYRFEFSHDSKLIYYIHSKTKLLLGCDVETGEIKEEYNVANNEGSPYSSIYTTKNSDILILDDYAIFKKSTKEMIVYGGTGQKTATSHNSDYIIGSSCFNDGIASIYLRNANTLENRFLLGAVEGYYYVGRKDVSMSYDGKFAASITNEINIWDLENRKLFKQYSYNQHVFDSIFNWERMNVSVFSHNSEIIVIVGGYVGNFNSEDLSLAMILINFKNDKGAIIYPRGMWSSELDIRADDKSLAYIGYDTTLKSQMLTVVKLKTDALSDVEENSKDIHTLSPNPATDFIYLPETNDLIHEAAIYSIFGEKVMQLNNSQSNIIDISGLSKGVYFLRINNNSYKFVKI